ncbi:hypothetical protein H5407_09330 [Mitsuaria sp. WAJ17]|uniref:hypothetical protein n=1 Tax=Mitsuaria sp. WAJ17 TaxID=2761452 RepID=UPI001601E54A|nr:hypothetical protein [Mitsuaria sp. WAJ17]MBB2485428.1 hypothetical protein [Mitsuaria sp. WAJ17]
MDLQQTVTKSPTAPGKALLAAIVKLCRRLHRSICEHALEAEVRRLTAEIDQLSFNIEIDDRLAAINRRLYLKSPTLQARRVEDRERMTKLQAHREQLLNQMAAPR